MTQQKATRFTISSHRSGYYQVSIPRLTGDHEVVKASDYDALLSEVAELKVLYDRIFRVRATGDRGHPVQGVIDYEAKAAFEIALEALGKER